MASDTTVKSKRLLLQDVLTGFLEIGHKAYFQPPESVKMEYPSIVYHLEYMPTVHADDTPYKVNERYLVTYITRDPDDQTPSLMAKEKGFSYDRYYSAENLHHHVFTYTFY